MSTERHVIELDDNISAGLRQIESRYDSLSRTIRATNNQLERTGRLQNQNNQRISGRSGSSYGLSSGQIEDALASRRAFRNNALLNQNQQIITSNSNVGRSFGAMNIAGIGFGVTMALAGRKIYESTIALEALETSLATASGSLMEYDRNARFFGETSRALGINTLQSADAFKGFIASAKGTAIEGKKARDIFKALTRSSKAMKLSGEQTNGVFLALSQMLSKGTVQSEELRGQLSERLPGAFSIMARALNVTTAELGTMLQKGEVLAADALPKFAKAMEDTFGGGVDGAIDATSAKVTMFSNKIDVLATGIGKKLTPAFNHFVDWASKGLDGLNEKFGFMGFGEGKTKTETTLEAFNKDVNTLNALEKANAPFEARLALMQKINAEGKEFMKEPLTMDERTKTLNSVRDGVNVSASMGLQNLNQEAEIANIEGSIKKMTKQYLTAFGYVGRKDASAMERMDAYNTIPEKYETTEEKGAFIRRNEIDRDNAESELEHLRIYLKRAKDTFRLMNIGTPDVVDTDKSTGDPTADVTGANGTTTTARAPKIYNINIPSFEINNEFTEVTNAKDAVTSITQNIGDEIAKLFAGIGYS